jgi:archaellum component FlaD/FlaE
MDIRERMNELENPFTLTAGASGAPAPVAQPQQSSHESEAEEAKKSAMEAREAALDARESKLEASEAKIASEKKAGPAAGKDLSSPAPEEGRHPVVDEQVLALLRAQVSGSQKSPAGATAVPSAPPAPPENEKLRLQKVYKLFKWTNQSVRKFGHDRLEIMLESYRAMGYISKQSCDEIREISRLMPANLGEEHEVGPDEYVAELYALNRILSPSDTSLDRDMIEVMMEKRAQEPPAKEIKNGDVPEFAGPVLREVPPPVRKKEKNDEWMNLPDRI